MSDKCLIKEYYLKLYSPEYEQAIAEYLTEDYIEHQYTAAFSKDGLFNYIRKRIKENPNHKIIIHKTLSEGNRVFLLAEEKLEQGVDVARAEMFYIKDGKITEHWGGQVIDEKNRKNTNGTFDGPQPDQGVDYASRYLRQFTELDLKAFDGQEIDCFYVTRTTDYKQHSPKGGDGIEGLVTILAKAKDNGIKVCMKQSQTLTEGDFLVCHRLYDTEPKHPLMNRINTFDIFRFNAEGKAIEHWDVMEDIPDEKMVPLIFNAFNKYRGNGCGVSIW